MNQPKRSTFSIILIGFGVCIVIAIATFLILRVYNKSAIDHAIAAYVAPPNCTERDRTYQQGDGIDSAPTWIISYDCNDEMIAAYKSIKYQAQALGSELKYDEAAQVLSSGDGTGDIVFLRDGYQADYAFEPGAVNPLRLELTKR